MHKETQEDKSETNEIGYPVGIGWKGWGTGNKTERMRNYLQF